MPRTVAQIDRQIARLKAKLRELGYERRATVLGWEARRARNERLLADFDAGCLNVETLAERHGMTVTNVRNVLHANGRSIIAARHQRLHEVAERHQSPQQVTA